MMPAKIPSQVMPEDSGAYSPFGTDPAMRDLAGSEIETEEREPMSDDEVSAAIRAAIQDATDFIDTVVAPLRVDAAKSYNAEPYGNEEPGRSQVVSQEVRDTVDAMMPDLMRVFFGPERVAEFMPVGEGDTETADQATDYIDHIVKKDNDGFLVLHSAFKDALVRKVGVVKYWWDESTKVTTEEATGLTEDDVLLLMNDYANDPDVEVEVVAQGPSGTTVRVTRRKRSGKARIEAVPPEELLVNRNARTMADATLLCHRRPMTMSALVAMGYDHEVLEEHARNEIETNREALVRNPFLNQGQNTLDESLRTLDYYESYVLMDVDGDGVAEQRMICSIGDGSVILRNEPAKGVPFAVFSCDPEPHEFFGTAISERVMDLQKIKSMITRNMLDGLSQAIHPRTWAVEGQANLRDVLNPEVGAVIRVQAPNMVGTFDTPFVGDKVLTVLDYFDQVKQHRTGVSHAASGIDADALQSTTKAAVAATVSAAHRRVELIARIFAETGMKQLFRGLLRLICNHQDRARMIRLRGKWVAMDPMSWDADMDVTVDVAVGSTSVEERVAALQEIATKQEQILQQFGPNNPLVTVVQYRNTLAQMMTLAGFPDVSRYLRPVTDEEVQAFTEQMQSQGPQANDPAVLLAQVQAKEIEANIELKNRQMALDELKARRDDDRERDKFEAELVLKAMELQMKYGTQFDMKILDAIFEKQRGEDGSAANGGPTGGNAPAGAAGAGTPIQ